MSGAPSGLYSPPQPTLSKRQLLQSPPAIVSLGSNLLAGRSRPASVGSALELLPDYNDDAVASSHIYQQGDTLGLDESSGRGGPVVTVSPSTVPRHHATGSTGATARRSVDRADIPVLRPPSPSLRRQHPFYANQAPEASSSRGSRDAVLFGDETDEPIQYGTPFPSSFVPFPPASPHTRGRRSDDLTPSSTTGAFPKSPSVGVDSAGAQQALLLSARRAQAPQSPKTTNPRRFSAGTAASAAGPGGIQLDSILMSSSQIASNAASPSRDAAPKRSSRLVAHIDGELGANSTAGGTPSLSASVQRKRASISLDALPGGRPAESSADAAEGSLMAPRAGKSLRVSLAHKALIGKGSYGMVFQAMDRDTNRIIAVKEIALNGASTSAGGRLSSVSSTDGRQSLGDDTVVGSGTVCSASGSPRSPSKPPPRVTDFHRQLEAVRKELAVLKQLDHPNIVKCLGEECDDSYLRIYMEFIAGGSVSSLLRTFGCFQERQASNFAAQMLEGLAYLHSKGIVHRDLKGDNLLVDPSGVLKLADFGTAKDIHVQTHTSTIAGTAYFMAPEVIMGTVSGVKSDIWSVGCCVIEMLTGAPPLSHLNNQYSIMMFIADAKGELFDKYVPADCQWTPEAIDFLRKCLQRDPAKRPSARELLKHPWIRNPTQKDTLLSPVTTVLTTTAIANIALPSPPQMERARSDISDGSEFQDLFDVGSVATADYDSATPTSDKGRKAKKEKKSKRDKKKSVSGSGKRRANDAPAADGNGGEYGLDHDFLKPNGRSSSGDGAMPLVGPRLTSPRWLVHEGRRSNNCAAPAGAGRPPARLSPEADHLPELPIHGGSANSWRSPFLPSLGSDKTPSSMHAVPKSNSGSTRGGLSEAVTSRRAKSGPAMLTARSSVFDCMSAKGSSHLTKSSFDSKDAETPLKPIKLDHGSDNVLGVKDDAIRSKGGNGRTLALLSPRSSQRKITVTPPLRVPALPSQTDVKKA